tara:strand:+ start:530 stop:1282 length:753 start_codon:yes stop_codon:yes gene_type:complete
MKKVIVHLLFLIFLVNSVYAIDLSEFPDMFIKNNNLNSLIVVGNEAPAYDVIAQTNLALFFGSYLGKPAIGYTKLASEVTDLDQNLILIGSPCHNQLTSKIMDYPKPCDKDVEEGKAVIKLFEDNANVYVVIMGEGDKTTQKGVDVLINYGDYSLSGDKFVLEIEEEITEEEEELEEVEVTNAEEEKQKLIEKLNKKISVQKEEENKDIEKQAEGKEPVLEEESEGPKPILKEEDNLIKKIISWFVSLFG